VEHLIVSGTKKTEVGLFGVFFWVGFLVIFKVGLPSKAHGFFWLCATAWVSQPW